MKIRRFVACTGAAAMLPLIGWAQEPPAAEKTDSPAEAPPADAAPSMVKPKPKAPARPTLLEKWAEIDTDKDSRASYDDITKVIATFPLERFNALDRNKDKAISMDEVPKPGGKRTPKKPGDEAKAAAAGVMQVLQAADADKDMKVTAEEFKTASPNAPEQQFKDLDRNLDGIIDRMDVPPQKDPQGGFRRADKDADGKVSREEFMAAFPKSPEDRFGKLDRNKDGFLDDVDRDMAAPPNRPAVPSPKAWPDVIKNMLVQMDKDTDGKLTFEEFSGGKPDMARTTFDSLDTNKDGVLTTEDERPAGKETAERKVRVNAGPAGQASERFKRADKNNDGKLSFEEAKEEFKNITEESFKLRDKNGDGFLGPEDRGMRPAPAPAPAAAPAPAPAAPAEEKK